MFQPFLPFKAAYIPRLLQLNKRYLVSQTYTPAFKHFDETHPKAILLSDYGEHGEAELHYKAVRHDPLAAIIDLNKVKHTEKMNQLLSPGSAYECYWATVQSKQEIKKQLDMQYKDNIRRYISKTTNWRIGSNDVVHTALQVTYGECYLLVKRRNQTLRVKFEDIEAA